MAKLAKCRLCGIEEDTKEPGTVSETESVGQGPEPGASGTKEDGR